MLEKTERWLTLGNQYVIASLVYLGLALILGGTNFFDFPKVMATSETDCTFTVQEYHEGYWMDVTYDGCPEGQQCCGGTCISEVDICCEDGTYGDADTCSCCKDCTESSCVLSTISCVE